MKIKKEEGIQSARQKYTTQFKAQVLERVDRDGVPKTAQDLGIAESILYSWRVSAEFLPLLAPVLPVKSDSGHF